MSNAHIRSIPEDDFETLRNEAAEQEQSLQAYMLEVIHDRAVAVRRRRTLADVTERLRKEGAEPIPMEDILAAKNTLDHEAA